MIKKVLFYIFIGLLILPLGITLLKEDKEFSDSENRFLTLRPDISLTGYLDTSLQKDTDGFLSDQFFLRDPAMSASGRLKTLLGIKDIDGTFVGKGGYLFLMNTPDSFNETTYTRNLSIINKLSESFPEKDFTFMAVPEGGHVNKAYLPTGAVLYDYERALEVAENNLTSENMRLIDTLPSLSSTLNSFYRTDHHWTTAGAYSAYRALMGGGAYSIDDAPLSAVSETFRGSLYSQVLIGNIPPEKIELSLPEPKVSVICDGKEGALYDREALKEKDKYRVFFGGNHGIVEITGGSGKGSLLVIKDSFANSLVPFLTSDYERIIMVDARYMAGTFASLIEKYDPEDVLILYQLSKFAGESTLVLH